MKKILLLLQVTLGLQCSAQDTLAVQNIDQAIKEAEKGNFVSLELLSDTCRVFPSEFFQIPNNQLIGLVVDNCSYEIIPEEINNYANLQYFRYSWFYFSNSPLKRFPDFIAETSSLEVIIIEGSNFQNVPSLAKLTSLKELSLYSCNLQTFPEEVLKLRNLEKLDLSCNKFNTIPENINQLSNLKSLDFEGGFCGATPISHIPETIGDLKLLENFSLGYTKTPIVSLPHSFYSLTNLERFECNGCGLQSLSEDLVKLKKLSSLQLTNLNFFQKFPEAIFSLSNMKYFHLYVYGRVDQALLTQQNKLDTWGQSLEDYTFQIVPTK